MKYAKAIVVTPDDEHQEFVQTGGQDVITNALAPTASETKRKGNFIQDRARDRQKKLITIVLKLAAIQGYNEKCEIKLNDGSYMPNTNIVELISHTLAANRAINGINQFVDLLKSAGVTEDLINNGQIINMLRSRSDLQQNTPAQPVEPITIEKPTTSDSDLTRNSNEPPTGDLDNEVIQAALNVPADDKLQQAINTPLPTEAPVKTGRKRGRPPKSSTDIHPSKKQSGNRKIITRSKRTKIENADVNNTSLDLNDSDLE